MNDTAHELLRQIVSLTHQTDQDRGHPEGTLTACDFLDAVYGLLSEHSAYLVDQAHCEPPPTLWERWYECEDCDEIWRDVGFATCDDRCPGCRTAYTPFGSDEIEPSVGCLTCLETPD